MILVDRLEAFQSRDGAGIPFRLVESDISVYRKSLRLTKGQD
jgi:hypothetical protein